MNCVRWASIWQPERRKSAVAVVNLGYVLNFIEDRDERTADLTEAWNLCQKSLVIDGKLYESMSRDTDELDAPRSTQSESVRLVWKGGVRAEFKF